MVCSYHSSCLDLPVALVDCQVGGYPPRLYHVCQGEYVLLNYINFDGGEWNIFRVFFDNLGRGGKSYQLKKLRDSTVSGTVGL